MTLFPIITPGIVETLSPTAVFDPIIVPKDLSPVSIFISFTILFIFPLSSLTLADPNNARAANELGVLLARDGRFEEARDWLRHSARLKSQPETWHNLAVVYGRLGQTEKSKQAEREQENEGQAGVAAGVGDVEPDQATEREHPGDEPPGSAPAPSEVDAERRAQHRHGDEAHDPAEQRVGGDPRRLPGVSDCAHAGDATSPAGERGSPDWWERPGRLVALGRAQNKQREPER